MKSSRAKPFLIALGFGAFAVLSILLKNELRKDTSPLEQFPLGKPMPDFALQDLQGKEFTLSQTEPQEKVILVNFWASWCAPCRLEMPGFEKMYQKDGSKGFLIVGIDEDSEPDKLAAYLKEHPVSFPILADPNGTLAKKFKIESLPTSILVSSQGKILSVVEGMDPYMDYRVQGILKPPKVEDVAGVSAGTVGVTVMKGETSEDKK
jgi:peroxiredoxin